MPLVDDLPDDDEVGASPGWRKYQTVATYAHHADASFPITRRLPHQRCRHGITPPSILPSPGTLLQQECSLHGSCKTSHTRPCLVLFHIKRLDFATCFVVPHQPSRVPLHFLVLQIHSLHKCHPVTACVLDLLAPKEHPRPPEHATAMPSAIYYASDLHVDHKANMEFLLQLKAEHYHEVRLDAAPK